MDKGVLEREKALIVKNIVRQTKSKRRQHRFPRPPPHQRPGLDPLPVVKAVSVTLPPSSPETVIMRNGAAPQDHPHHQISEGDVGAFNEPIWSQPFYSTILAAESFITQEGVIPASSQRPSAAATTIGSEDVESNSTSSDSSVRSSEFTSHSSGVCEDNAGNGIEVSGDVLFEASFEALAPLCEQKFGASYHESDLSTKPTANNQAGLSSLTQKSSSPTSEALWHHAPLSAVVSNPILHGDMEDALFMYYLDRVFYVQYPFYHISNQEARGFLFSILRRVKSAYHAALALSEYHQQSTFPGHNGFSSSTNRLREKGGHYDLALREMQLSLAQSHTWNGTLCLIRSVETLSCILQFLFWEVRLLPLSCAL
jgi:hypothetical protein